MIKRLQQCKHAFSRFFLQPALVAPFVFLRIAFACMVLLLCVVLWPNLYDLYSAEGYMQWVISDNLFKKEFIPNLHWVYDLVNKVHEIGDVDIVKYLFVVFMVCIAMIGVGFFSNYFALIGWFIHLLFLNTGTIYGYGVETFIHVALFYMIFMPVDARYSITALILKKKFGSAAYMTDQQIKARLFLRLLQLHLCLVYFNAGFAKLWGQQWFNGEAVWRSFTQFPFNTVNLTWLSKFPVLLVLLGWMVLTIETMYPLLIWHSKTRKMWLAAIVLMHMGIAVVMNLYFFSAIMIILNITAFGFNYQPARVSLITPVE